MIEVLVTILILAIGLLGVAALQVTGLRGNNSASFRTSATTLANEIAERMHANIAAANDGCFVNIAVTAAAAPLLPCATPPAPAPNCEGTVNCGVQNMAQFDINDLQTRLGTIPGASFSVTCAVPCNVGATYTVSVDWTEVAPDGTNTAQTATVAVVP